MEYLSKKKFSLAAKDYKLYEEVGEGVSATVYRALCIPLNEIVAIKIFDLEKFNNDLDGIRREAKTMSLLHHPNLLRAHCSFATGSSLWIVMPYMSGGSCLHIMKSAYPEGFEQPLIATLLYEVLKALAYLHANGLIHRDVKAGNILVDSKGAIKLADFGVAASLYDAGDRQRSRNTFVGTPCWMAPEVMQQLHGYDFKADIWSFGITALELAHGHAPFSKYPPMKVLLMTLQNAPPGLDYERDKKFSKSFKEIVAACLVKDPKKRPTAEKLLKHRFFKHARSNEFLSQTVLDGLSPLGDRFRMLKEKEADILLQNKAMYEDKDQLSQREYIRGISAWNFDLEDLKKQAALIQDDDGISNLEHRGWGSKQKDGFDNLTVLGERPSEERLNHSNIAETSPVREDGPNYVQNVGSSPASFPVQSLQALDDHSVHQPKRENSKLLPADALDELGFQNKGRFKIAVADSSPKLLQTLLEVMKIILGISDNDKENDAPNGFINPFSGHFMPSIASSVLPTFHCLLQQNAMQREQIVRVIRYVNQTTGNGREHVEASGNDHLRVSLASARERVLQVHVTRMHQCIDKLIEELHRQKMKNAELERQLSASLDKA